MPEGMLLIRRLCGNNERDQCDDGRDDIGRRLQCIRQEAN